LVGTLKAKPSLLLDICSTCSGCSGVFCIAPARAHEEGHTMTARHTRRAGTAGTAGTVAQCVDLIALYVFWLVSIEAEQPEQATRYRPERHPPPDPL